MKISLKQKLATAAAAATLAGGAGLAFAYWTSEGTGSGSAGTGSDAGWTVATDAAVGDALTPGGPEVQTVDFHVTNDSTGHQGLQAVAIKVANADGTSWSSGSCDADDFSVGGETAGTTHTITYTPVVDLAGGATHDDDVTITMVNKVDANQDDCKNVIVPLHLAAS